MRRTAEDTAKTREKILDVSLKVFGQKGFGQTKLSDIAKEAEITRGAIYHHFNSKADLFSALLDRYHNKIINVVKPYLTSEENAINRLKNGFKEYFALLENDIGMLEFQKVQFLKQELLASSQEFVQCKEDARNHFQRVELLVEDGQRKGEINQNVNSKEFSFFLMGYIFGIINNWLFFDEPFKLSETGIEYLDKYIDFHLK